jgi:quercetin dioxygenase-like cupin family protein
MPKSILRQTEINMKPATFALLAIAALSLSAAADEPTTGPQPVRSVLDRHDQSGVAGKEIVIGTATLPVGTAIPFHTHPGDESGYALKGPLIVKMKGQPDRTLKTGESFFIPRGTVHTVAAPAGGDGAMAVSTWIVDKGQPLATTAPASP